MIYFMALSYIKTILLIYFLMRDSTSFVVGVDYFI